MDSQNLNNEVVYYSTFFLYPFKFRGDFNGLWQECSLELWQKDMDPKSPLRENNQEVLYFHRYLRNVLFNLKDDDKSDRFLSLYSLTLDAKQGLDLSFDKDKETRVFIDDKETSFYIFGLWLHIFKDSKIGILSINIKSKGCSLEDALGFNKYFRLLYLTDTEQVSDKRFYERISIGKLTNNLSEQEHFILDESENKLLPKNINSIVSKLLPNGQTPILDDRMIVHGFIALNELLKEIYFDNKRSRYNKEGLALFSRALYVDDYAVYFLYEPAFIIKQLLNHLYTRWEHYGTLHGFCRYAGMTMLFGAPIFLETNFRTVYYQMAILSLFYRCALIDFADRSSRITKDLIKQGDWTSNNKVRRLREGFLKFSNVWYFKELTNQEQGIEMFDMQRKAYELDELFRGVKEEIEKLDEFIRIEQAKRLNNLLFWISLAAVGIALLSLITGFFGMNLEYEWFNELLGKSKKT